MSPAKRKQIDSLEKAIEAALSPGCFISYNAAWSFVEDVQGVADDISKIIRKEPERAARLYEIFIAVGFAGSRCLKSRWRSHELGG